MQSENLLSSSVTLVRNFAGLPFDLSGKPDQAVQCISRTIRALASAGQTGFRLLRLRDMPENDRQVLAENGTITPKMLSTPETAAILQDMTADVVIQLNGTDHLRIRAFRKDGDLRAALAACLKVEDALNRQIEFAFDERLGYLTSSPKEVGTGMKAAIRLHLPMMTMGKQIGHHIEFADEQGLELCALNNEGPGNHCGLYELCNRASMGITEDDIVDSARVMCKMLCEEELELREKGLQEGRLPLEDLAGRAWGTLLHARLMPLKEFWQHWSHLRLGAMLKMVGVEVAQIDSLLEQAQPAHLRAYAGKDMSPQELDACRASRVRAWLYHP